MLKSLLFFIEVMKMELMELIVFVIFIGVYGFIMSERIYCMVVVMVGVLLVFLIKIVLWEKVLEYFDFDMIFFFVGMMVVVNVVRESGLFEYIVIKIVKFLKGSLMKVFFLFLVVMVVVSVFFDNVMMVFFLMLMFLYIIKKMGVNLILFLFLEVFVLNIGGIVMFIGDLFNIMIGFVVNFSFNEFIFNMGFIVFVDFFVIIGIIYFVYCVEMNFYKENEEVIKMIIMLLDERDVIRDFLFFRKFIIVFIGVVIGFFFYDKFGVEFVVIVFIGVLILFFWSRVLFEYVFEKVEWVMFFFFWWFVYNCWFFS